MPREPRIPGLRRLFRLPPSRHTVQREVDDEIRFHLETRIAELIAAGRRRDDAELEARGEFGDVAASRRELALVDRRRLEQQRRAAGWEALRQDLAYAIRSLRRQPAFAAIVVLTLALGIGVNAAIFSAVNAILLQPLPFHEPDRLARVGLEGPYANLSEPELMDLRRDADAFGDIAAFAQVSANLTGDGEPRRVDVARVTDAFFETLGVPFAAGRSFTADENAPGGPAVAIIDEGVWRQDFGGDPELLGRTIELNGSARTVVGILSSRVDFPSRETAVWVPLQLDPDSLWTRNNHYLAAVGRLAPGATLARARSQLAAIVPQWQRDYPDIYFPDQPLIASAVPIADSIVGEVRPFLIALIGAVGFVLLIACVNVANLLLARGESRRRELAVRMALGASRGRVVRQVLTEGLLLALAGGALGLVLAWWSGSVLLAVAPDAIPRLDAVRVDGSVLAFTLVASILAGLLATIVPAIRVARHSSSEVLRDGGRTATGGSRRTRGALVVAEVALAVVTLAGAGLMLRSLWELQGSDLGFRTTSLLTMRVSPTSSNYETEAARALWRDLMTQMAAIPGVEVAAAAGSLPIANEDDSRWSILVDGRTDVDVSETPAPKPVHVTPNFFRALDIPIVRGRGFTEQDRYDAALVTVINEAMAREVWPGEDPIGRTIKMMSNSAEWATVIGVVRDVRSGGFRSEPPPTMYFPHAQADRSAYYTPRGMTVTLRTVADPMAVAQAARSVVRGTAPDAPVTRVRTMEQVVAGSIAERRLSTSLLAGFAGLALVLSAIGIYGVIAYGVTQRTREIGVRLALGAQSGAILALVLGDGFRLALLGLAIGMAAALASLPLLRSLLVGVSATDPVTLVAVALGLLAVALLASAVPARRATRVDPINAMRAD